MVKLIMEGDVRSQQEGSGLRSKRQELKHNAERERESLPLRFYAVSSLSPAETFGSAQPTRKTEEQESYAEP